MRIERIFTVFFMVFGLCYSAFAQLGESRSEFERLYGSAIHTAGNVSVYGDGKYAVLVQYENGRAIEVAYSKAEKKVTHGNDSSNRTVQLNRMEMESLLLKNRGAGIWKHLDFTPPASMAEYKHFWFNAASKTYAYYNSENKILYFTPKQPFGLSQ
jgi:hypothetical protein